MHEPAFIKLLEDYARCEQQQQDDSTTVVTWGNMTFCDEVKKAKVQAQKNPFYARHRSLVRAMDRIVAREKQLMLRTLSQTSAHLSSGTAKLNPPRIDDGNRRRRLGNPVSGLTGAIASCWIRPAAEVLPVIPAWPPAASMPVATLGIQTVPSAAPHSSVEESPAQCTETARSLNNSYSYGDQLLEIQRELDQVAPVGVTLQSDGAPRFFSDHQCMQPVL